MRSRGRSNTTYIFRAVTLTFSNSFNRDSEFVCTLSANFASWSTLIAAWETTATRRIAIRAVSLCILSRFGKINSSPVFVDPVVPFQNFRIVPNGPGRLAGFLNSENPNSISLARAALTNSEALVPLALEVTALDIDASPMRSCGSRNQRRFRIESICKFVVRTTKKLPKFMRHTYYSRSPWSAEGFLRRYSARSGIQPCGHSSSSWPSNNTQHH